MRSERVAQVFAGESRGSGYLIAPSLVLTAAHVIDGAGSIEVRTVAALERCDRTRIPATLLRRDAERDLALLAIPSQQDRGTTLFGTLSGQIPVPVDALGFPDAMVQNGRGDT